MIKPNNTSTGIEILMMHTVKVHARKVIKHLLVDINEDEVLRPLMYLVDKQSFAGRIIYGQHLLTMEYDLMTGEYSETLSICNNSNKAIMCSKEMGVGENVDKYLQDMHNPEKLLFPLLQGYSKDQDNTYLHFPISTNNHIPTLVVKQEFDVTDRTDVDFIKGFSKQKRLLSQFRKYAENYPNDDETREYLLGVYDKIVEELQYSTKFDVPTVWGEAEQLPKKFRVRHYLNFNSETNLNGTETCDYWFVVYNNKTCDLLPLTPTNGIVFDTVTGKATEVYDREPYEMPDNVIKAIRITIGVNPVGDTMRGVAFRLYNKNPQEKQSCESKV